MHDGPTVELFRMFFAHHVKTSRNGRVDADREVVVDDVARNRVAFLVPVLVPVVRRSVVVVGVERRRFAAAVAVAVGDGGRRGWWRGRRRRRRRAELDVPTVEHHDRAACDAVNDLTELFALVACHTPAIRSNRL